MNLRPGRGRRGADGDQKETESQNTTAMFMPLLPPKLRKDNSGAVRNFLREYEEYTEVFEERKHNIELHMQPTALFTVILIL